VSAAWPTGAATGVGSLPGRDPDEACRLVVGELPELPHLPELPGRGAGADPIGRSATLLAELSVDLQPAGWRLTARPGIDERRARSFLQRDLDALEEHAGAHHCPVKVQCAGPWTLAASLELPRGGRVLADPGAVSDVAAALAEGLARHVADVARRLPNAAVLVQLDEPALPAVLAGRVPTASGFGALRAVAEPDAVAALATVLGSPGVPAGVHCCAPDPPVDLLVRAGASALSLDLTLLGPAYDDPLASALESGVALLAGVVPATDGELPHPSRTVATVRTLLTRIGLQAAAILTPTCGLAGVTERYARAALAHCREAARLLAEQAA
jgi:methionine synthase II (cobalamin-independent)